MYTLLSINLKIERVHVFLYHLYDAGATDLELFAKIRLTPECLYVGLFSPI